jgi:heme/copper-type cytochrome/quinol oxidase subunit 3
MTTLSTPEGTLAAPRADDRPMAGPSVGKVGMWMFIATDAMGFGALLLAYGVLRVHANQWPDPQERLAVTQAALMTAALVTSSCTLTLALYAARARREGARLAWLAVTIILGLIFLAGQVVEYQHLVAGPHPMGLTTDLFAGTFYTVTGYHGVHVVVGLGILIGVLLSSRPHPRTLEVAAIFWHFVDLAWIPIFSLLYLLPVT